MTLKEPAMELSAAKADAEPSDAIVTAPAERPADAPDDGAVKVTAPPATGSIGLLAVTTSASGLGKPVPSVVCWGVLPETRVSVKPWLWKAPMSGDESSGSPRWSVVMPLAAVPAPIAGLPGSRAIVGVGPP